MKPHCDTRKRSIAMAFGMFFSIPIANAQTCAAPGAWHPDTTGAPGIVADLCALPDSVSLYCDFLDSAGKNDAIYQIVYALGFTSTSILISGSSAGFNPVIFLYTGACATASNCAASGDTNNPLPVAGLPPGTYFLGATAAPSDATGACGTIAMTTNGYIPVELQSFDID
jgi:hypothetical protein